MNETKNNNCKVNNSDNLSEKNISSPLSLGEGSGVRLLFS